MVAVPPLVVQLSHSPRPLQITGPNPSLTVAVNVAVVPPITMKELPEARLRRSVDCGGRTLEGSDCSSNDNG